jgi:hypothetical protein
MAGGVSSFRDIWRSLGELGERYKIRVCGTKLLQNCGMFFSVIIESGRTTSRTYAQQNIMLGMGSIQARRNASYSQSPVRQSMPLRCQLDGNRDITFHPQADILFMRLVLGGNIRKKYIRRVKEHTHLRKSCCT